MTIVLKKQAVLDRHLSLNQDKTVSTRLTSEEVLRLFNSTFNGETSDIKFISMVSLKEKIVYQYAVKDEHLQVIIIETL
jgi:hypothetical protein